MCNGIALIESEIPIDYFEKHDLARRRHCRGGEAEVRFVWRDPIPMLPIIHEGKFSLVAWGNQNGGRLPRTGWTWKTTIEGGGWNALEPARVDIPASFGLEGGVWFRIREGIRGLLVHDERRQPHAYMVCEPPTRYYRVMTRGDRMPSLIDEVI